MKRILIFPLSLMMLLALCGGTYLSAARLDDLRKSYASREDYLYLPNGSYLDLLSLDYDSLVADLLWIKGAVYFGSHYRLKGFEYPWLYHILDMATTLDPQYYDVYWYGSSILPTVEETIKLLEKGRKNFPSNWKLPEMIGFNYHFHLKDYFKAAQYYEIASSLPGHPPYVPSLAGRFYEEAGDLDSAIRVLNNFYITSERDDLKEDFARRIQQLSDIKLLTEKVEEFEGKRGSSPEDLQELLEHGFIPEMPLEPYGGEYLWDAQNGRVISSTAPRP